MHGTGKVNLQLNMNWIHKTVAKIQDIVQIFNLLLFWFYFCFYSIYQVLCLGVFQKNFIM